MPPRLFPIESADMNTWSGAYVLDSGERVMLDVVGPALRLRAPSLQADAEIFASERVTPDDLLQKSQQIELVMGGILAWDLRPLFDAYDGRVPLADLERIYGERISDLEKLHGSILASRILGTRPQGDEQLTYFEIQCERGRVDGAYIWEDERLRGLDLSEHLPPALFYPSAQGRFESYTLHGPSLGALTIRHPLGDPIVIQIEHGGRRVTLRRAVTER